MKIYKTITSAPNYKVSNDWEVVNIKTGRIIRPFIAWKWYYYVTISVNKVWKNFLVHRLVAIEFIPNPDGKRTVNHKDGNKLNNNDWNLEWSTDSEQWIHRCRVLWKKTSCFKIMRLHDGKIYNGCGEAAADNGISRGTVSNTYTGKHKWKILFKKI